MFNKVRGLILDNALFVLGTGDKWKRHRKMLQPAFGPMHLRHAAEKTVNVLKILDKVSLQSQLHNPYVRQI